VQVQVMRHTDVDLEALARPNRCPDASSTDVARLNGIGFFWRQLGRF
jgi:hypothetical protein